MPVIIDTGVDNAGLRAGLLQAESMVDAAVKRISVKMNAAGKITGASMIFAPAQIAAQEKSVGLLGLAATHMTKLQSVGSGLNTVLGRMTGIFSSGLGISAAIGGLALLGSAFSKAITMAERFQTAQISIGAILLSTYKIKGPTGKEATGPTAFLYAHAQALKYNDEIITRSRNNILTYEEQLKAFQVGLAAGGRKGIKPAAVMDISEQIAVGAKSIGLQGERISEQVRILLGGGVNVQRSMFAKMLGITSLDISTRSGTELTSFIQSRLKGFKDPGVLAEFNTSIQKIITTMQSQIDVFLANVGTKTMKRLAKPMAAFGTFLEGPDAAKFGDVMVEGFTNLFKAIEAIAKSPAIPVIASFVKFLAGNADKIIIGAVLLKLVGILASVQVGISNSIAWFNKLGASAAAASVEVNGLAAAEARVGEAGLAGAGAGVGGGRMVGVAKGVAAEEAMMGGAVLAGGLSVSQKATLAGIAAGTGKGMGPAAAAKLEAKILARNAAAAAAASGVGVAEEEAAVAAATAGGAAGIGRWGQFKAGAAGLGGKLSGFGSKMLGRALPAAIAGDVIEYAGSATGVSNPDQKTDQLTFGGVGTDIAAGAAAGGIMGGLPGAIIGATSGFAKSLLGALGRAKTIADETETALDAMYKKYPTTKKLAPLISKLNHAETILSEIKEPTLTAAEKKAGVRYTTEGKTRAEWAAEAKALHTQINAIRVGGGVKEGMTDLQFEAQTKATAAQEALKRAQEAQKTAAFGYGPGAKRREMELAGATQLAEAKSAYTGGTLGVSDADLIGRYQAIKAQQARMLKASEERGRKHQTYKEGSPEAKAVEKTDKEMTAELQKIVDIQYGRLAKSIPKRTADQLAAFDLDKAAKKRSFTTLPSIESDYLKGREAIQKEVLGEKGELGADYAPTLKKALKNFDLTFNKPLKKIEHDITNMSLGVSADNVIEAAHLSFQAVREKIREQVEAFRRTGEGLAPGKGHEFLAQQETAFRSLLERPALERQQFMGEEAIKQIQQRQELAMGVPNAQRTLAQTRLQGQEFEAGLNPRNANIMARAQRIVGLEQPRIGLDEAERMVRQKIELEREGQRAAMQQATSGLEIAKIQHDQVLPAMMKLGEILKNEKMSEFNKAATDAAKYLRDMIGGKGKSSTPTSDHKAVSGAEPAKTGAHGTAASGGHTVNIAVSPKAGLTMEDINALLPQIKDALCRQAAISGSRG